MQKYIDINSIADIHKFYKYDKPQHPLITIIDLTKANPDRPKEEVYYRTPLYSVMCKRFEGSMKYGKSHYDFEEGTLMFTAPHQVISSSPDIRVLEGWGLFFHPDLLHASELGRKIHEYNFFHYDVNEALHISDTEKSTLLDCLQKIENEYSQNFDRHTQGLILDNLQLMLNYCTRFYGRQFLTRAKVNHDIVQKFERLLSDYFATDTLIETGLPDVKHFASQLRLSPDYLSDLLSKYTGKTTLEHIHLQLIDKAKSLLLGSQRSISEIAYDLGFGHPSHFTKIFKSKTGMSPRDFRSMN
ncbi:MAG TPA: helix-turn-helix transcriptional regulator [Ohtaekwangia sp.]|uniref:helix-turn-helix domain-containing protein n=1 Tax=Ohtaekwangia sp. TaxID=2066019 RepID=UPI002F91FBC9